MKLAFLLGSPDISGGSNAIFEHAVRMHNRGNDVTIIMERAIDKEKELFWHTQAKVLNFITYEQAKNVFFDVVIATWCRTAFNLFQTNAKTYAYFVQAIESNFFEKDDVLAREMADASYLLPCHIITEVNWIKDYLKNNYNKDAQIALNGMKKDLYTNVGDFYPKGENCKLRVLVEGHLESEFKNIKKTLKLCTNSEADEVWLLTRSDIKEYPSVDRVFSRVEAEETAKIYRSCDVLVKLSYIEGMFAPPLEMFHCGGTTIVYDIPGHEEYIRHGENGFVVKVDDDDKVLEYISLLRNNQNMLQSFKDKALEMANSWHGWEEASIQFENALINMVNNYEPVSQFDLEKKSQFFINLFEKKLYSHYGRDIINSKIVQQNIERLIINCKNSEKILFYGAGTFSHEMVKKYDLSSLNLLGFVDKDVSKAGKFIGDYQIYTPDDIAKLNPDIVLVSMVYFKMVIPYLNKIKEENNLKFHIIPEML